MCEHIKVPHIYAMASYREEFDEESGLSIWAVHWEGAEHLPPPDNINFGLCGIYTIKMEVV